MASSFVQDKGEIIFYTWDFSDILDNYTIVSYTVTESSGHCIITNKTNTPTTVTALINTSNAEVTKLYRVVCNILTTNNERLEKTITIIIMEG